MSSPGEPVVLLNGQQAGADALRVLAQSNYGHFTSLQVRGGAVQGLDMHLDRLRQEGLTLVVVDQMAGLALALADRAYVMAGGHIVAQGTSAEIAADEALSQAYLGAH